MLSVMEDVNWEIRDVEQLREHYSRTCRQWAERLEQHRSEALQLVPEKTYRIWRLYLTASSVFFAEGAIGLYQVVASKLAANVAAIPFTREDIYRPGIGPLEHRRNSA
jgi:cyclopropane-fatty-acyl-phospholipid synthase